MRTTLFLTILIILLPSCEDELLDFNFSLNEETIVINSFFNDDELFHVNISRNQLSTDGDTAYFIENATVLLYGNDTFLDTLKLKENGNYISNNIIPEKDVPYKIKVEVPGVETATTDYALIPSSVNEMWLDTSTYLDANEKIYRHVNLKFKDIEGLNYYLLYMIWEGTRYEYDADSNIVDSVKTKATYGWGEGLNIPHTGKVLFTDESFEGDTIERKLYFRKHMPYSGLEDFDNLMGYFKLCTISEEYYLYAKSYSEQHNSIDWSVFVEPVTVYSNINNGLGIFAGYGQCIDSVFYKE